MCSAYGWINVGSFCVLTSWLFHGFLAQQLHGILWALEAVFVHVCGRFPWSYHPMESWRQGALKIFSSSFSDSSFPACPLNEGVPQALSRCLILSKTSIRHLVHKPFGPSQKTLDIWSHLVLSQTSMETFGPCQKSLIFGPIQNRSAWTKYAHELLDWTEFQVPFGMDQMAYGCFQQDQMSCRTSRISPTPASLSASTFFKDNFICELRSNSHFFKKK